MKWYGIAFECPSDMLHEVEMNLYRKGLSHVLVKSAWHSPNRKVCELISFQPLDLGESIQMYQFTCDQVLPLCYFKDLPEWLTTVPRKPEEVAA